MWLASTELKKRKVWLVGAVCLFGVAGFFIWRASCEPAPVYENLDLRLLGWSVGKQEVTDWNGFRVAGVEQLRVGMTFAAVEQHLGPALSTVKDGENTIKSFCATAMALGVTNGPRGGVSIRVRQRILITCTMHGERLIQVEEVGCDIPEGLPRSEWRCSEVTRIPLRTIVFRDRKDILARISLVCGP